jgi:hypothetical protein
VRVVFPFTIQVALADHVPLTVVADGSELDTAAAVAEVLPAMSAPPPTSFALPVQDAVEGPNVVPGF